MEFNFGIYECRQCGFTSRDNIGECPACNTHNDFAYLPYALLTAFISNLFVQCDNADLLRAARCADIPVSTESDLRALLDTIVQDVLG